MKKTQKREIMQNLGSDEVKSKIRTRYLKGWKLKEILDDLGISEGTFNSAMWRNTHNINDFMANLKKEYFLQVTEQLSRDILLMDASENAKILTIKQKESEFVRETLLKDHGYTKRTETLGINLNKNEPLNEEQQAKIDLLLGK